MSKFRKDDMTIYDPEARKRVSLESLITRLGVQAVAKKYKVTAWAVIKWRSGLRRPAKKTLAKLLGKELFSL